MFLQIVAMDHFMQIIVPKFVCVQIVIPDNHFWQIVFLDSILANCCSKQFFLQISVWVIFFVEETKYG